MLPIEYRSTSEYRNKTNFTAKCLNINISAQTAEGVPFNIVVKNVDPDGQVKINVEKGTDYYFPFSFFLELKGEYGEVELQFPEEMMENGNDKE